MSCSASQSRSDSQRLGQPRQLLVGREVAVAHDGGRGDGEVDRARAARRRARPRPRAGRPAASRSARSRARPRAQLVEHRAHDVAPQRREVVALVEQHDADAELARSCCTRCARGLGRAGRASSTPACSPRATSRLSAALIRASSRARRSAAAPSNASPSRSGLLRRHAGRRGALVRPARLREPPEHDLGVLELAQRLVGQAGDRLERVGAGDPSRRARA